MGLYAYLRSEYYSRKNKGSVTVNGVGLYGGKVTAKFTILGKDVHNTIIEKWKGVVALSARPLSYNKFSEISDTAHILQYNNCNITIAE